MTRGQEKMEGREEMYHFSGSTWEDTSSRHCLAWSSVFCYRLSLSWCNPAEVAGPGCAQASALYKLHHLHHPGQANAYVVCPDIPRNGEVAQFSLPFREPLGCFKILLFVSLSIFLFLNRTCCYALTMVLLPPQDRVTMLPNTQRKL